MILKRKMGNKNVETKNKIVTIIIYGLLIYIAFILIKPMFSNVISKELIYQKIKKSVMRELNSISYVCIEKNNKNTISQNVVDIGVSSIINTPLFTYASNNEEKKDLIIPENYMMTSELTGETKEESVKNEMGYLDAINSDSNNGDIENNQKDIKTTANNEPTQATAGTDLLEVQQEETESKDTLPTANNTDNILTVNGNKQISIPTKIQDIPIESLNFQGLINKYYTVVSSTSISEEDLDPSKLMNMDMSMKQKNDAPQILIYHTHGQEQFSDSTGTEMGVIGIGNYLTDLLTNVYGYKVIHVTDSYDLVNGVLDRHKAYDYAYTGISQVLADNPSIEVVLDIHRDGVDESNHLVTTVNGKPTAKIMFFNGISRLNGIGEIDYLYNPYRTENLAMSMQMKILSEEYFEGFTRRNYIQAYEYNLHVRPKSMLIEVGAQTNTFEEAKNAMEPLAMLLSMVLK